MAPVNKGHTVQERGRETEKEKIFNKPFEDVQVMTMMIVQAEIKTLRNKEHEKKKVKLIQGCVCVCVYIVCMY